MSAPCKGCGEKRRLRNGTETRIVYTAGVWDVLHKGHLNILRESRKWGDLLVVGVVSDDGTEAYKGVRPVQDEQTRLEVIRSLGFVDFAVLQPGTDPSQVVEIIRPNVFTHGSDWSKLREGNETLARLGIQYVTLPYTNGVSTTMLRERMFA